MPCGRSSGSKRLDFDEIAQLTWRIILEELIRGGDNFAFNFQCAPVLSQCSDLRVWSGLEGLEAATTAQARAFWIC